MPRYARRICALMLGVALLGTNAPQPIAKTIDGRMMVAVLPLAQQLGIPVKHVNGALALQVDGSWVQLRPNDITLHEGDTPVVRLTSFPTLRDGRLFINAADVSTVLDVEASVRGGRVLVAKKRTSAVSDSGGEFDVSEVAAPRPSPKASVAYVQSAQNRKIQIGNISASVFDYAQQTNYNALVDGGGDHFHATLYVNGMAGSRPNVGGTIRVGDVSRRHLSAGGINDPLFGEIFTGGGANGIEGVNANGTFASYSTTTVDARHVIAAGSRSGQWVREVAITDEGGVVQPLLGLQQWNESPHYVFDRELWTGLHGIGAGLRFRTTGQLYADVRLALAGAGLPLVTGDALTQASVGYDISSRFGVRAGYGIAHAQSGEAVLQIYGGIPGMGFTVSHYGNQNGATLDLGRSTNTLRLQYIQAPGYGAYQSDGAFEVARGIVETRAYLASDSSDIAADYRFKQATPSLSVGIESVRAQDMRRVAPTVGYLFPVSGSLSLGFEYHPLANGNGIRFTAAQSLYMHPMPAHRTIALALQGASASPVYLLVDGVRTQRLTGQLTDVSVENGSHYLAVQSEDGRFGSPEQRVIDGSPHAVSFSLWPLAEVRGSIRLPEIPLGMARPSLGAITVMLQPQGITTQTESDGSFVFPAQPLDPATQVTVDTDSLPKGLAAGPPQDIAPGQPTTILLHPSTKIEKVIF